MDRKGQIGFGFIIMAAVAILVGLALYTGTFSQNIGSMTNLDNAYNVTMTLPASNITSELSMCGQKVNTITVTNATGGTVVTASNYTTSQSIGADGYLAAKITPSTASRYASTSVNVSCNYEPDGYIAESGGRAVVGLIAIFMALLILVAALPNLKDKFFDFIKT